MFCWPWKWSYRTNSLHKTIRKSIKSCSSFSCSLSLALIWSRVLKLTPPKMVLCVKERLIWSVGRYRWHRTGLPSQITQPQTALHYSHKTWVSVRMKCVIWPIWEAGAAAWSEGLDRCDRLQVVRHYRTTPNELIFLVFLDSSLRKIVS